MSKLYIKIKHSLIIAYLSRFIGLNGKSLLTVPNAYNAGWTDCLKYLSDNYDIDIEIEDK